MPAMAWPTEVGVCRPRWTRRRSAARRICAAIRSTARSSAAILSALLQPWVAFLVHLDLHADDAMVVLLQPGQLLLYVTAKTLCQLHMPAIEHDVHDNLPIASVTVSRVCAATLVATWKEPVRPTWSSTPQPPAETLAACMPLPVFSPGHAVSDDVWEAGLTSKPHRDRRPGRSPRHALRGPFRLRLASACRRVTWRTRTPAAQPRTRTDSIHRR